MKYLIAGICAFLISLSSLAQTNIALHAGYTHNTAKVITGNNKQPAGYVPGFSIGARVKTAFEPPLYFVGMISYSLRGYTLNPLAGDTSKLETHIHYIDIAPMLNYDISLGNNRQLSLTVGPVLGVAFSGRQKITENGITSSAPMKFSISNNYGYFNVGIHNGISYRFNKMFIEGSYHLGVSSINNNEEMDNTNIKNRGFALSVGYWFK
jgi:hypothetical protein